jgi:hypothetical protein
MCYTLREERISKSAAARAVGIARMTVYRYAKNQLVSENEKGRVLLSEVKKVWESPIRRIRAKTPRAEFTPGRLNLHGDLFRKHFLDQFLSDLKEFIRKRKKLEKAKDPKKDAKLIDFVVNEQQRLESILTKQMGFSLAEANAVICEETSITRFAKKLSGCKIKGIRGCSKQNVKTGSEPPLALVRQNDLGGFEKEAELNLDETHANFSDRLLHALFD